VLDVKWIRDNKDAFIKGLTDRGFEASARATLNKILKLDEERRAAIQKLQDAQARRNAASKEIGAAKAKNNDAEAKRLVDEVGTLKGAIQDGEAEEKRLDDELRNLLATIPNNPAPDVPVGPDADANVELREFGKPTKFSFQPKQHFEIGEGLGLMDFETAAKLSGARFVVLKGALARLERALAQFMLDLHTSEHGYTEVAPPLLVRTNAMYGTGQLPKFEEDLFQIFGELSQLKVEFDLQRAQYEEKQESYALLSSLGDLVTQDVLDARDRGIDVAWAAPAVSKLLEVSRTYAKRFAEFRENVESINARLDELIKGDSSQFFLIPTAEVPLTNLVREEIVDAAKLPMRVTAGTPCFRAEAGAAGKDTRGMIRQHQFNKVELVSITTPEQSAEEHERMTKCAETVLQKLELPYRVVVLSTGDMGFAAQKTYDIEVWLPGQGTYREISSCSNCGDFQARRMNARWRPKDTKQPRLVHTLNGSGVAVGRALIAVLENYQEEDGSVRIPDVLKSYMGGLTKIEAPR
jgi:seryl-tRNA synthetase